MILEIFPDSPSLPLHQLQPSPHPQVPLHMLLIVTGTLVTCVTQVTVFVSLIDSEGALKKVL